MSTPGERAEQVVVAGEGAPSARRVRAECAPSARGGVRRTSARRVGEFKPTYRWVRQREQQQISMGEQVAELVLQRVQALCRRERRVLQVRERHRVRRAQEVIRKRVAVMRPSGVEGLLAVRVRALSRFVVVLGGHERVEVGRRCCRCCSSSSLSPGVLCKGISHETVEGRRFRCCHELPTGDSLFANNCCKVPLGRYPFIG